MKKATTTKTTPTTTEKGKTLFTTPVLTAYENAVKTAYNHDPDPVSIASDPTVNETMQAVGQWSTFSVLKKLRTVGGQVNENDPTPSYNPVPVQLTRDLVSDLANIDRRKYAVENDHEIQINKDGDPVTVFNDLHKATPSILAENLTDAYDLLQTALLTVWTETVKVITDRPADLDDHFMTTPVTVRRLRKKVYIKDDPTDPTLWETIQTTPVQIVFKAVRREIENNRSVQVNNKYVYIDDLASDPTDPDHTEKVYRRLDRLTASLTADNMTVDLDGRPVETLTTADPVSVTDTTALLTALNLTTRQMTVLKYMIDGYGQKAIATRLSVCNKSVWETIQQIRKKAVKLATDRPDLFDPSVLAKYIPTPTEK